MVEIDNVKERWQRDGRGRMAERNGRSKAGYYILPPFYYSAISIILPSLVLFNI